MTEIVFFGTHEFAASILEALILSKQYEIKTVITQPDRPVGRRQEMIKPAVKLLAEKYNLNILQPESLKNFQFSIFNFQLIIVCQYGKIIPKAILDLPKHGAINIHASLLPKYRGASPIQFALMKGETETGISIMLMDEKMDEGPVLSQTALSIGPDDTYLELSKKLEPVAAKLLLETLPKWLDNSLKPQNQDNAKATYTKILTREDGKIDWTKSADEIYNLYRGLTPWPGVWTTWNGKRLKLLRVRPLPSPHRRGVGGEVSTDSDKVMINTSNGAIEVVELQLEGKTAMNAKDFLNGYKDFNEARLN